MIIEVINKLEPLYNIIENTNERVTIAFNVEEEESAKDIDLDVSESVLKLTSTQ